MWPRLPVRSRRRQQPFWYVPNARSSMRRAQHPVPFESVVAEHSGPSRDTALHALVARWSTYGNGVLAGLPMQHSNAVLVPSPGLDSCHSCPTYERRLLHLHSVLRTTTLDAMVKFHDAGLDLVFGALSHAPRRGTLEAPVDLRVIARRHRVDVAARAVLRCRGSRWARRRMERRAREDRRRACCAVTAIN